MTDIIPINIFYTIRKSLPSDSNKLLPQRRKISMGFSIQLLFDVNLVFLHLNRHLLPIFNANTGISRHFYFISTCDPDACAKYQ